MKVEIILTNEAGLKNFFSLCATIGSDLFVRFFTTKVNESCETLYLLIIFLYSSGISAKTDNGINHIIKTLRIFITI